MNLVVHGCVVLLREARRLIVEEKAQKKEKKSSKTAKDKMQRMELHQQVQGHKQGTIAKGMASLAWLCW